MANGPVQQTTSPFITFTRSEWSQLRAATPLTLSEADLVSLRGVGEQVSLAEIEAVYLPVSRLLSLYVEATQSLYRATDTFLGNPAGKVPFVIGVAGSVAVGKSTSARILQALLGRWEHHPRVDLVTTDGFLHPNRVLEERGLMTRKGFPESYDVRRLLRFLMDVKSGRPEIAVPVYSHLKYDIIPDAWQWVRQPDIVIVEGLNILQTGATKASHPLQMYVSDFIDFAVYVHADEEHIQDWYVKRFLRLRETAFRQPESYFRRYAAYTEAEAVQRATQIWEETNGPNLRQNIVPTRGRADLILFKAEDHAVQRVQLRKI